MTEHLRLALAIPLAVVSLVILAIGTVALHAGRRVMAVADRVSPPSDW